MNDLERLEVAIRNAHASLPTVRADWASVLRRAHRALRLRALAVTVVALAGTAVLGTAGVLARDALSDDDGPDRAEQPAPAVEPADGTTTAPPATGEAGGQPDLRVVLSDTQAVVTNTSTTTASGAFTVEITRPSEAGPPEAVASASVPGLEPLTDYTLEYECEAGVTYTATVDPQEDVEESDEQNNSQTFPCAEDVEPPTEPEAPPIPEPDAPEIPEPPPGEPPPEQPIE